MALRAAYGGLDQTFRRNCDEAGFLPEHILPHDSYLINLGAPEADKIEKSRKAFVTEMQRAGRSA